MAWSFSQIRGTAKNSVGWTSLRFDGDRVDRLGEVEHRAAAHEVPRREDPLGDVAQRQVGDDEVVLVRAACRRAAARARLTMVSIEKAALALVSIAPFGGPVVPDV